MNFQMFYEVGQVSCHVFKTKSARIGKGGSVDDGGDGEWRNSKRLSCCNQQPQVKVVHNT